MFCNIEIVGENPWNDLIWFWTYLKKKRVYLICKLSSLSLKSKFNGQSIWCCLCAFNWVCKSWWIYWWSLDHAFSHDSEWLIRILYTKLLNFNYFEPLFLPRIQVRRLKWEQAKRLWRKKNTSKKHNIRRNKQNNQSEWLNEGNVWSKLLQCLPILIQLEQREKNIIMAFSRSTKMAMREWMRQKM